MGRGRLVFKGANPPKKKSSINKHSAVLSTPNVSDNLPEVRAEDREATCNVVNPMTKDADATNQAASSSTNKQVHIRKGTGQITSSATVVTGHNTKFMSELKVGDAIIIYNQRQQEVMRVVTMRLSDISCAISSPFSNDCKCLTEFYYIQKPRNKEAEERKTREEKAKQKLEEEQSAFGTYSSSDKLVYHEKSSTGTSYIIKTEILGKDVTRGELLDMRSKKKSDKYCH